MIIVEGDHGCTGATSDDQIGLRVDPTVGVPLHTRRVGSRGKGGREPPQSFPQNGRLAQG